MTDHRDGKIWDARYACWRPAEQYGDLAQLLPCPFCGSPARTDLLPHSGGPGWVQCSQCECDQFMSDTMEEAVAKWNTRATRAAPLQDDLAHPERLKALSDAADYVEKIGARYHSGRDIANGIRCLSPQGVSSVVERQPTRDQIKSAVGYTSPMLVDAIADDITALFKGDPR